MVYPTIRDGAVCLKPKDMVAEAGKEYTELLPVMDGKLSGGKRLMIDIYPCMAGGGSPTPNIPSSCDMLYRSSGILTKVYEKTVNVKFYDKPINNAFREIDRMIPADGLRYEADATFKWIDLYTDIGQIAKDWTLDKVATMQEFRKSAGEKKMSNIMGNFLSQGKVIMADFDLHIEISTSNNKTEIYRYYYTVIDVFAAVGGLLQF